MIAEGRNARPWEYVKSNVERSSNRVGSLKDTCKLLNCEDWFIYTHILTACILALSIEW